MKLLEDLNAFSGNGKLIKKVGIIICNPNFHAVFLYRLSSLFYRIRLSPLAKLIWYLNRVLFSIALNFE